MTRNTRLDDVAPPLTLIDHCPTLESVPEQVVYGLLTLTYASMVALTAVVVGLAVVYLASVAPETLPVTILLWAAAIVGVSASPNLAGWLLRRLLT